MKGLLQLLLFVLMPALAGAATGERFVDREDRGHVYYFVACTLGVLVEQHAELADNFHKWRAKPQDKRCFVAKVILRKRTLPKEIKIFTSVGGTRYAGEGLVGKGEKYNVLIPLSVLELILGQPYEPIE